MPLANIDHVAHVVNVVMAYTPNPKRYPQALPLNICNGQPLHKSWAS